MIEEYVRLQIDVGSEADLRATMRETCNGIDYASAFVLKDNSLVFTTTAESANQLRTVLDENPTIGCIRNSHNVGGPGGMVELKVAKSATSSDCHTPSAVMPAAGAGGN